MEVDDGLGSASNFSSHHLDAHAIPPESLKKQFKQYQKGQDVNDLSSPVTPDAHNWTLTGRKISGTDLEQAYNEFLGRPLFQAPDSVCQDLLIYEARELPGLVVYPSLLPLLVQRELLN